MRGDVYYEHIPIPIPFCTTCEYPPRLNYKWYFATDCALHGYFVKGEFIVPNNANQHETSCDDTSFVCFFSFHLWQFITNNCIGFFHIIFFIII